MTLARPSWNPLDLHSTALPASLLLCAKMVALGLICKGYFWKIIPPFAPMPGFGFLEAGLVGDGLVYVLRGMFVAGIIGIALNRWVRVSCALTGSALLIATLASMFTFRNATTFAGLLLVMISLTEAGKTNKLIWWQLGVMYLLAGLNKLAELDWHDGTYFDYFLGEYQRVLAYMWLDDLLPGQHPAIGMSWWVIFAEVVAGVCFFIRRRHPLAVWFALTVHLGAGVMVGGSYAIYLPAILASYISLIHWPAPDDHAARQSWRRWFFHPVPHLVLVMIVTVPQGVSLRYTVALLSGLGLLAFSAITLVMLKRMLPRLTRSGRAPS